MGWIYETHFVYLLLEICQLIHEYIFMKEKKAHWTFLSNHSHVLLCLAREPDMRMRDVAVLVGITERAVQRIVKELTEEGILRLDKKGRRNHYHVLLSHPLRHPLEAHHTVGDLLVAVE